MIKRIFDGTVAALALLLLAPVFLAVAVAIKLDDGGRVFFRHERVGRHGRIFRMRKFRTMRDAPGLSVTIDSDTRITRVGRFLRLVKLDELPQFLDVLCGRMSLVGPRPEVPEYVACWPVEAREVILAARPGLTDPAILAFRHESAWLARVAQPEEYYRRVLLPRKVNLYVRYVRTRSFLGDLRLLAATARAIFTRPEGEAGFGLGDAAGVREPALRDSSV
ncbi:sugar transferase [Plantactinospora sp. GCM10030261]|uniref:sugar transferase n=1 Tax=Plantactinospora sp. GCM10030261 TaxID=3273420 RepID=UPI0036161BF2